MKEPNPIVRKHIETILQEKGYDWAIFERRNLRPRQGNYITYSRHPKNVQARAEVWAEARRRDSAAGCPPSLKEICAVCGCSHSTILTAIARVRLPAAGQAPGAGLGTHRDQPR